MGNQINGRNEKKATPPSSDDRWVEMTRRIFLYISGALSYTCAWICFSACESPASSIASLISIIWRSKTSAQLVKKTEFSKTSRKLMLLPRVRCTKTMKLAHVHTQSSGCKDQHIYGGPKVYILVAYSYCFRICKSLFRLSVYLKFFKFIEQCEMHLLSHTNT